MSACLSLTLTFLLIAISYSPKFWPRVNLATFNLTKLSTPLQALLNCAVLKQILFITNQYYSNLIKILKTFKQFAASTIGSLVLCICFLFIQPPSHLPDLWTVAICIYSCIHFIGFSVLFHLIQFSLPSVEASNEQLDFESCFRCQFKSPKSKIKTN